MMINLNSEPLCHTYEATLLLLSYLLRCITLLNYEVTFTVYEMCIKVLFVVLFTQNAATKCPFPDMS